MVRASKLLTRILQSCLIIACFVVQGSSKIDNNFNNNAAHAGEDVSATVIPLNEQGTRELFDKWLSQALSGLLAAVAQKNFNTAPKHAREHLHVCSKMAQTVPAHANCVTHLLHHVDRAKAKKDIMKKYKKDIMRKRRRRGKREIRETERNENEGMVREHRKRRRREKRESEYKIVTRDSYQLRHKFDESPMVRVAQYLTNTVRRFKNKERSEGWRQTMIKIRKTATEEKELEKGKKEMKKRLKNFIDNTPTHLEDPIKKEQLREFEGQEAKQKAKKAKEALLKDEVRVPMKLVRDAVKMTMVLTGRNVSEFDKKTIRIASPRFFSVVKDQEHDDMIDVLSPSLLSLHSEGEREEQLGSLPNLLKTLSSKDRDAWIDFIVESAGVTDAVESARAARLLEKEAIMRAPNGAPYYFTKENVTERFGDQEGEKIDIFHSMNKRYTTEQKSDLDKQGFSFLNEEQVDVLYGEKSPYHDPERIHRYKAFARLEDSTKHLVIRNEIRHMSKVDNISVSLPQLSSNHTHSRSKRNIVLSPIVLTPLVFASVAMSNTWIVLSPLVLSPVVLSPAALGPVILSPWVFIPVILSPRLLSPLIVNPLIFSPVVLSPLCLHPFILSPGIFNPVVLSPFVLSPFILSPQVFTPVILSPFALSPLILNPTVGSPLVLSPFVLSPLILSPQTLFAVVLSPYALSPLIESKLTISEIVMSPSVLS